MVWILPLHVNEDDGCGCGVIAGGGGGGGGDAQLFTIFNISTHTMV